MLAWPISAGAQAIRYVKQEGSGDGSSWAQASGDLQAMIDAEAVQQVWVAQGTYKPTLVQGIEISFSMKNGVSILGGFPATGNPDQNVRNPASYTTVLSGNRYGVSNSHIIRNGTGLIATAVLDGFTLTNSYALDEALGLSLGGAIYNNGQGGVCSPTIRNCVFIDNVALVGGAIYNDGSGGGNSSPQLINCSFINNQAEISFFFVTAYGGAICNDGSRNGKSTPLLINCSFINNQAYYGGGAIFNEGRFSGNSSPILVNCSFLNNAADHGGAFYNTDALGGRSELQLTNCVFFSNGGANTISNGLASVSASYSLFEPAVRGYSSGPGNLTSLVSSPFAGSTTTRLAADSPAINAGDPASTTLTSGLTDVAGNARIQNGRIDMGAHELGLPSDLTPVVYARPFQVYGTTDLTVVVDVVELNEVATSGSFSVRITKDPAVSLTFPASATLVNGRPVQNSLWQLITSDPDYYLLTTTQPMEGGGQLSVGLTGVLTPGSTTGVLTLTATLIGSSVGEYKLTNNTDADKIEYFP